MGMAIDYAGDAILLHRNSIMKEPMKIYFMRHAESEANAQDILAGRHEYPLTARGVADAEAIAVSFLPSRKVDAIVSSPLLRAQQTGAPFAQFTGLPVTIDESLIEQNMGRFSGKTYSEVENDPAYEHDKTRRWGWAPPDGGESYEMIADRVRPFFTRLEATKNGNSGRERSAATLVVTHAVTLRLVVGLLEDTLPRYPSTLVRNGEILEVDFQGLGQSHAITSHYYGNQTEAKA
jgi:broad specificity phosphatase PhoE